MVLMTIYLSCADVAEQIGESVQNVRRRCLRGQIAAIKLGDKWRIHPDAVEAFMQPTNQHAEPKRKLTARQRRRVS